MSELSDNPFRISPAEIPVLRQWLLEQFDRKLIEDRHRKHILSEISKGVATLESLGRSRFLMGLQRIATCDDATVLTYAKDAAFLIKHLAMTRNELPVQYRHRIDGMFSDCLKQNGDFNRLFCELIAIRDFAWLGLNARSPDLIDGGRHDVDIDLDGETLAVEVKTTTTTTGIRWNPSLVRRLAHAFIEAIRDNDRFSNKIVSIVLADREGSLPDQGISVCIEDIVSGSEQRNLPGVRASLALAKPSEMEEARRREADHTPHGPDDFLGGNNIAIHYQDSADAPYIMRIRSENGQDFQRAASRILSDCRRKLQIDQDNLILLTYSDLTPIEVIGIDKLRATKLFQDIANVSEKHFQSLENTLAIVLTGQPWAKKSEFSDDILIADRLQCGFFNPKRREKALRVFEHLSDRRKAKLQQSQPSR